MSGGEDAERRARLVHDLRAPLTLVLGFTDLLHRRGDAMSDDERAEAVARVAEAATEMRRILDADGGNAAQPDGSDPPVPGD